jgi:hypothetical protein
MFLDRLDGPLEVIRRHPPLAAELARRFTAAPRRYDRPDERGVQPAIEETERLARWLDRAVNAATATDIFEG